MPYTAAADAPFVPEETVAQMEQDLNAAGKRAAGHTYPGMRHRCMEPTRADACKAAATELVWQRTLTFRDTHPRTA